MKRLIRLGVFAVIIALGICGFVFGVVGRSRVTALPPTNPPHATALPGAATVTPGPPTAIPEGYVSREMMGADWPLTVDYGDFACEGNKLVTFRSPMGDVYAVNAPARSQMEKRGWRDILTIDKPGADLFAFIDIGLKMCQ